MSFPKGKNHTIETRERMRQAHLARGTKYPSWSGKHHTTQTKLKIGLAQKKHLAEHPERVAVLVARNKDPNLWTPERRLNSSIAGKKKTLNLVALKKTHEKNRGKKRTAEQRERMSLALRGSKSSFWKGGVTSEHQKIRSSAKLAQWRKDVFTRDKYTCQKCGRIGGYLQAHHIQPFAYYPELRFELSNGVTLCVPCHKETDSFGHKARGHEKS